MQKTVKFGGYIIIPLKYDADSFQETRLKEEFQTIPITTMDLNENVKEIFNHPGHAIGTCYGVERSRLCGAFPDARSFTVVSDQAGFPFQIRDSYLYVFHTQVAFLCLQVIYDDMEAIHGICNPGFADSSSRFSWTDGKGESHDFSLETWLEQFLAPFGLRKFFDGRSSFLLDAYMYLLALMPERFRTLEEMKRLTFNLHQMVAPDTIIEDESEDDIRYVYAVKTQSLDSYRWGCCIASQTISYVFADAAMDLDSEMLVQARDGLPMALLALYEKYTCLRFTQLIAAMEQHRMKQVKKLKKTMLEFQAYGTISPANLSRWHNVKQIYAYMLEVNDIATAVSDVSAKINILVEQQEELERSRNEKLINLITVFGMISILASVLEIIQTLSGGGTLVWATTIVTNLALLLSLGLAARMRK